MDGQIGLIKRLNKKQETPLVVKTEMCVREQQGG